MSDDITHDLDLLDDWLAGKGYGEEAGLVLRAMTLINAQARELRALRAENEKLRAVLEPFVDVADNDICDSLTDDDIFRPIAPEYSRATVLCVGDLRAAAAALKETGD